MALARQAYLALLGKEGLREIANCVRLKAQLRCGNFSHPLSLEALASRLLFLPNAVFQILTLRWQIGGRLSIARAATRGIDLVRGLNNTTFSPRAAVLTHCLSLRDRETHLPE